jgi:hypothetical protein
MTICPKPHPLYSLCSVSLFSIVLAPSNLPDSSFIFYASLSPPTRMSLHGGRNFCFAWDHMPHPRYCNPVLNEPVSKPNTYLYPHMAGHVICLGPEDLCICHTCPAHPSIPPPCLWHSGLLSPALHSLGECAVG